VLVEISTIGRRLRFQDGTEKIEVENEAVRELGGSHMQLLLARVKRRI